MYTIGFARGFIYGSCAVIFGWLIHQLSGIEWWKGIVSVVVVDVSIRAILHMIARKYLARHYKEVHELQRLSHGYTTQRDSQSGEETSTERRSD
jgi:hypothetical protein